MSSERSSLRTALTTEQLDALRTMDTCAVSNAIEATGVRLRNEGYMDATVRSLFPELPPLDDEEDDKPIGNWRQVRSNVGRMRRPPTRTPPPAAFAA